MMLKQVFQAVTATVVFCLVTIGLVATEAHAASLSGSSATSSAIIGSTGTNAAPIVVSATAITGGQADKFLVGLPLGWTFVAADSYVTDGTCPVWFTTTLTSLNGCQSVATSFVVVQLNRNFASGEVASVTFSANSINVGATRDFAIEFAGAGGAQIDSGTALLAGGSTNSTVTFNANGGTGEMADQVSSTATSLSTNVFSRSGHSFAGWNTSANGSGTEYADASLYPFTSDATLYAQWTSVLAQTGSQSSDYLNLAGWLVIAGAGLIAHGISRRNTGKPFSYIS